MSQLNPLQQYIFEALKALHEKAQFNEAVLAKKVRELAKVDSKKKAGISLKDLECAVEAASQENIFYSLRLNSANDLLIIKSASMDLLNEETHHRRHQSEKSMTILTLRDLQTSSHGPKENHGHDKKNNRSTRTKININSNFEDME